MSAHLPLASNFGDLPDPLRPLTMMRKAAHINLPLEKPPAIPFPDAATLDTKRAAIDAAAHIGIFSEIIAGAGAPAGSANGFA